MTEDRREKKKKKKRDGRRPNTLAVKVSSNQSVVTRLGGGPETETAAMMSFNTSTLGKKLYIYIYTFIFICVFLYSTSLEFQFCPEKLQFLKSLRYNYFFSMAVPDNSACCHFAKWFLLKVAQLLLFEY